MTHRLALPHTDDYGNALPGEQEPLSLMDRLEKKLEGMGLHFPDRPVENVPDLPNDLGDCPPAELSHLLTIYSGWLAFVSPRVRAAMGAKKSAKLDLTTAKHFKPKDIGEHLRLERVFVEKDAWALTIEGMEKSITRRREAVSRQIALVTGMPVDAQ